MNSRKRRWVPGLALAAILVSTLTPTRVSLPQGLALCLLCGTRGLADAILNVALFAPLGAALASRWQSALRPILAGFALSGTIELIQILIPGRDPVLGDVLFNTLGAGLGAVMTRTASGWVTPAPARARLLSVTAIGAALAVLWGGAALLQPALPNVGYYGQWTPEFSDMEQYRGRIVDARIGAMSIPSAYLRESAKVRADLLSGVPLQVHAVAGPRPRAAAPLFNIYDDRQREILSLVVNGNDLVLNYRMRASLVLMDQPHLRVNGALEKVREGEPLRIEVRRVQRGFCLEVNQERACPLGFTLGDVWGVLFSLELRSQAMLRSFNFLWLCALFAPAGFWLSRSRAPAFAVLAVAALWIIPHQADVLPSPSGEFVAVVLGLAIGWVGQRWVQAKRAAASRLGSS